MGWRRGAGSREPAAPGHHDGAEELLRRTQEQQWAGEPPAAAAVELVAAELRGRPDGRVVVVGAADVEPWTEVLRGTWPALRITQVRLGDDPSERHVELAARGPHDVVVDASDTTGEQQARLFQRVFMHLRAGGAYLACRLAPATGLEQDPTPEPCPDRALPNENVPTAAAYRGDLWTMLSDAQAARLRGTDDALPHGSPREDVDGLGSVLREVRVVDGVLRVVLGRRVSAKLREDEVDAVLAARPRIGTRLHALPPVSWTAESAYRLNRPRDPYVQRTFDVPGLALRRYDAPTCSRGQVVTSRRLLLPETYRQHWMDRMYNVYVVEKAPLFGAVRRDLRDADVLPGAYFHLDSEWPGHFGHLLTEQLGRLWAWERAREQEPGLKLLTTLQHDRDPAVLAAFEIDILGCFGIQPEDVHVFARPCVPERLYTATSMYSLPRYVHPRMADLWDRVGDRLAARATTAFDAPRLFVSRRPSFKRACHNTSEVEELFRARGFEVVFPEDHPLPDQVAMFRAAEVVAGFAGSGLFSLALARGPKEVITLAPDSYTARNEHLISAVRGHSLTSVWSRPDLDHPPGTWTQQAFASNFTFDLDDEGRFLADCLARLDE